MPNGVVKVLVSGGWWGQVLSIIRAIGARPPSSDRTITAGATDDRPPGIVASHPRSTCTFNLARTQQAVIGAPAPSAQFERYRPLPAFLSTPNYAE
jgi:hypothetical protein